MPYKKGDAMRLIAKRPCRFGGRNFYIGDEVPAELVADPAAQERLGVLVAANDAQAAADGTFTREQVDIMIAEVVTAAEQERESRITELEGAGEDIVIISVKGETDGEMTAVPASPKEIQQVFTILQMNADEGIKQIADVTSENVLILLHAADSRKTIKNAARERAERLFSSEGDSGGNDAANPASGTTDAAVKGADD